MSTRKSPLPSLAVSDKANSGRKSADNIARPITVARDGNGTSESSSSVSSKKSIGSEASAKRDRSDGDGINDNTTNNNSNSKHTNNFDRNHITTTPNSTNDHPKSSDETAMFKIPEVPDDLSAWIHSMYVVTFDIEFGQAIELRYPVKVDQQTSSTSSSTSSELTETEINNICYSSFPDSNSCIQGSAQFHFRMRLSKLDTRLKKFYLYYNRSTTQALNVEPQFVFGYVHFLQRKDSSLKRGYFQKSFVILSLLPFVELFYHIVKIVGTHYFENEGLLNLENVYNQTKRWPTLLVGLPFNLTLMGSTIAFYIPNRDDKLNSLHANLSPTSSSLLSNRMKTLRDKVPITKSDTHLDPTLRNAHGQNATDATASYSATSIHGTPLTLGSHHSMYSVILTAFDLDLYKCFHSVISDLQLLWEMILTCEPFIVIAPTPDVCASFVQSMISLIYPFKYNADYRPFFTIHDQEFREYAGLKSDHPLGSNGPPRPNVILGVTNPFFAKSLEHWPNVVQICGMTLSKSSDQLSSLISSFSSMNTHTAGNGTGGKQQQLASQYVAPSVCQQMPAVSKIPFVDRLRFVAAGCESSFRPGLNTKLKPFLQKDRNFLTKILRSNKAHGSNRPTSIQTALIRRWLIELTQSFFMPLERYLTQLMPLHNKISPFKAPPELPSFDREAFLATLETSGPQLTTKIKGDWLGLYRKFFASANFYSWYSERKSEIDRKLWTLHMESFIDIDLVQAIRGKAEVEVVDMIIFLRRRLAQMVAKSHEYQFVCDASADNMDQFREKLAQLINKLPEDLRTFFQQSTQY